MTCRVHSVLLAVENGECSDPWVVKRLNQMVLDTSDETEDAAYETILQWQCRQCTSIDSLVIPPVHGDSRQAVGVAGVAQVRPLKTLSFRWSRDVKGNSCGQTIAYQ